jgi:hypothetical protein
MQVEMLMLTLQVNGGITFSDNFAAVPADQRRRASPDRQHAQ